MGKDRNRQGRFTPEHTDEEILGAVRAHEPAATSEVARELGASRQAADYRLRRLRDEGRVSSKKIGASLVWFAPQDGGDLKNTKDGILEQPDDRDDRRDATEARRERADVDAGGSPGESSDADTAAPRNAGGEASIGDVLDGWRPGKSLEKREQQLAAGRAALEYLRNQGVAQAAEFKIDVENEYPVDGQSPETWWKKSAREALSRAQEAGVVEYVDGGGEWHWVGDG